MEENMNSTKVYMLVDCERVVEGFESEDVGIEVLNFDSTKITEEEWDRLNQQYTDVKLSLSLENGHSIMTM